MVILFPFDGKWRNPPSQEGYLTQFLADKYKGADNDQVPDLVTDFVRCLEDPLSSARNAVGLLQAYLDDVINDIHAADTVTVNGGADVYCEMNKTFTYLQPPKSFLSVGTYLEFRRENVCAGFVFASIKFSLHSRGHPTVRSPTLYHVGVRPSCDRE
jgi:hypothetical protein